MPMKRYYEKIWHCSWSCGYGNKNLKKVIKHEKIHVANERAAYKKLLELFK